MLTSLSTPSASASPDSRLPTRKPPRPTGSWLRSTAAKRAPNDPSITPVRLAKPKLPKLGLAALLVVATLACYARVITLPLVQDDWTIMARFAWASFGESLARGFAIDDQLFLRPGGLTVLLLEHAAFGSNALGYHVLALLLHAANALLVVACMRALTLSARAARLTGFLYAGSTSIHLDTMIWAVGIYDLGASFCSLLCVLAFARGRSAWAALALLLGLSFKESVIAIPAVLAAITLWQPAPTARGKLRQWWPIIVVVILFAMLKSRGQSVFALPEAHPYAASPWGLHILDNLRHYAVWAVQSLLPIESPAMNGLALAGLAAAALGMMLVLRRRIAALWLRQKARLIMLMTWAIGGMLPVLVMRDHAYRYYLGSSLPALLALLSLVAVDLLDSCRISARTSNNLLAIGTGTLFALAASHLQVVMNEGPEQHTLFWGTNHLVQRARPSRPRATPCASTWQMLLQMR